MTWAKGLFSLLGRWVEIPFHYRTIFLGFLRNDFKGRFAGAMGGFFWTLFIPLANLLIYLFVFSVVLRIRLQPAETGTDSFAVYFLTGLLPWTAFSEALRNATEIFLGRPNLVTKVAFPLEVLPLTGVVVPFLINGVGFGMYLIYLLFKGYLHLAWFWLPLIIALHMLFTLGLVTLISSLSVFVRDIQQFIGTAISLWFFMTPIIYPLAMVPDHLRWVIQMNPMYPFIELYHQALLRQGVSLSMLGLGAFLAGICFVGSVLFFERSKHAFADVL